MLNCYAIFLKIVKGLKNLELLYLINLKYISEEIPYEFYS